MHLATAAITVAAAVTMHLPAAAMAVSATAVHLPAATMTASATAVHLAAPAMAAAPSAMGLALVLGDGRGHRQNPRGKPQRGQRDKNFTDIHGQFSWLRQWPASRQTRRAP